MDFDQHLRSLRNPEELLHFVKSLPAGRRIVLKAKGQQVYGFQAVPYIAERVWYNWLHKNTVKVGECDVPHVWRHMRVI